MTYRSLVVSDGPRSAEDLRIGNPFFLSLDLLGMTVFTVEVRALQEVTVALDATVSQLKIT